MFKSFVCQAMTALSLYGRPWCLRQGWRPHPSSGRHNTGNVSLAPLPKPQHTDGGEQKACGPPRFSCSSSLLPSPPGSAPSPPSRLLFSREQLTPLRLTKGHAQNTPKYGQAERGAIYCHSVFSLDFVFTLLFKCQRNKVHLGANKSFG